MRKRPSKSIETLIFGFIILLVAIQIFMLVFSVNIFDLRSISKSSTGATPSLKMQLNTESYNKLLEHARTIQLNDGEKDKFAGFNVRLPCCGFAITSDEQSNCGCGHHVAFAGLIKHMTKNGYSHEQIQQEIDAWKPVFYPECLSNKNLCDLK